MPIGRDGNKFAAKLANARLQRVDAHRIDAQSLQLLRLLQLQLDNGFLVAFVQIAAIGLEALDE